MSGNTEEEKLLRFLQLGDRVEDLYLVNSYFMMRNFQKVEWKIDWKTFILLFALADQEPQSIADLIKRWPFFRHYKDISPRLPPLLQFGLVEEETGPKNAKLVHATTKGQYVSAFFFYLLAYETEDFSMFKFLKAKLPEVPGFSAPEQAFQSIKIIKSQLPAMIEYIPKIQENLEELNWRLDYKLFLIPLYLLDADDQSYTDLMKNYPQFGYYRELKQRIIPLTALGIIKEEKAGRKGAQLSLTTKGRTFLCFVGYLMAFPQFPA
nr:hypothetical protein [Candidatus Sigynarchaeota archaeon]